MKFFNYCSSNSVKALLLTLSSLILAACIVPSSIKQAAVLSHPTLDTLIPQLLTADYILLGEEHDQPKIHLFRARLLKELAKHRSLLVSVEHITSDKQPILDANLAHPQELQRALDWNKSGWPKWSMFLPLFEALRDTRAIVRCGNRRTTDTFDDLIPYGLNAPLPHETRLREELEKMHPPSMKIPLERMVLAQRRRDAALAVSLDQGKATMRILLAGNGHIRKDYGVPWYIRYHNPEARVLAIGIISGTEANKDKGVYDYLVRL